MKRFLHIIITISVLLSATGCTSHKDTAIRDLEKRLSEYIADKDARIGIAVIIDGKDTVAVNGGEKFPMLSVYKFPQALAVADYCVRHDITATDSIDIRAEEMHTGTWSPMREKYGVRDIRLPLSELLQYTLSQSDNNACDVLFRRIGGVETADSVMKALGYGDIAIATTEDEMHRDLGLCYRNTSTPVAMASLFDEFYRGDLCRKSPVHETVARIMTACETGTGRLPSPLKDTGAKIGHKTGTGDVNRQGRIIAVNDAGYVFLPDGRGYSIAVFVSGSVYDMPATERMIADISGMVFETVTRQQD